MARPGPLKLTTLSIAASAVVLAIGMAYGTILESPAAPEASSASPAEHKPRTAVAALGRIEPQSEIINLAAGSSPDRLASLLVGRGDRVAKDQVLGYLGGYAEQIAQRDLYTIQLDEARSKLKAEIALDDARIAAAEAHQKQILEVSPQRIEAQNGVIASLEAKLTNDRSILRSQDQLLARGASTPRQADDQKSVVLQDEANANAARARLLELERQFETDKVDAAVQVEVARATRERMRAEFPVASLERQVALAQARASRMTIYAPTAGRILDVRVKPGEEVGSDPILVMGDTARMRAVAEVYETDIARVKLGQSATITSRALSGPIPGKVVRIGHMIFKNDVLNVDPAARADARVVQVWIDLDDRGATADLTNLTVDVVIDTTSAAPAVATSAGP